MRAIIHSIHSQVPRTIAKLESKPGAVISLDSHLDVSLGGDDDIYPDELRAIARRTGAHTAIRRICGTRAPSKTRVVVAIPEAMLSRHAMDTESNLPRALRIADHAESVESVVDFLRDRMAIEVFQSPPESLSDLIPVVREAGSWLLDVDVDCMQEMQSECYTRIINPRPGTLQSMAQVVDFVRISRPEIITISEAKLSAIRDHSSNFSSLMAELVAIGYPVEEAEICQRDDEVRRGILVCKEFYGTVSKALMLKHMKEMMKGDLRGFRKDEETAARAFFTSRGYVYGV